MDIDSLVNEKIESDADFQATIADLPDDEKNQAIETKRKEVFTQEISSLKEKADKATKAEELAENYKLRAEKAEKAEKENKGTDTQAADLSTKDLYALMEAKVPEEDVSEVAEYAQLKKISIREALKTNVVKTILKENADIRQTANATHTGRARTGAAKTTSQEVLTQARRGVLPESTEDIDRLVTAEMEAKTVKK